MRWYHYLYDVNTIANYDPDIKAVNAMKPGAKVALIEFREGELPAGPPPTAKVPKAALFELMKGAGPVADGEIPDLLPYQVFLVFR